MRGGKRQDQAVNQAKGNPGGRKPGKSRAKPAVEKIDAKSSAPTVEAKAADLGTSDKVPGAVPRELTKEGKAVWRIIAPLLARSNFYHKTYAFSLTRYCDTVAEYWKVTRELRRKSYVYKAPKVGGGTILRFNPLFMVQDRLARRLDTLEHNFGLNPRARGEVMARLTEQIALPLAAAEDPAPRPTPDPVHESAVGFLERLGDDPERLH